MIIGAYRDNEVDATHPLIQSLEQIQKEEGAKKSEFIHEEAIAYERAAEFYLSLGREEIRQLYLRNAHHCYSRWGAKAKVQALEAEYSQLFVGRSNKKAITEVNPTESTTGAETEMLDLTSVIKSVF